MADFISAVESITILRKPLLSGAVWQFHIHWKATNGAQGCQTKALARTLIAASPTDTLARIALTEQALTGNALDPTEVKLIINLQRVDHEVQALAQVPNTRIVIPIPIIDRAHINHPVPPALN